MMRAPSFYRAKCYVLSATEKKKDVTELFVTEFVISE